MAGLLGKKIGMTRIYDDKGKIQPITVLEAGPCVVLEIRDKTVQLGFEDIPDNRIKNPQKGFFKKLGIAPKRYIREIAFDKATDFKIGDILKADLFKSGEYVKVTGTSKGKGFQGGVKRWNWKGGPRTHGSTSHRRVGSIGSTTTPGRTLKGHHMPGHMGDARVTVKNLKVLNVNAENNIIAVTGAVPGAKNSLVEIKKL